MLLTFLFCVRLSSSFNFKSLFVPFEIYAQHYGSSNNVPIAQNNLNNVPIAQNNLNNVPIAQNNLNNIPIAQNDLNNAPAVKNNLPVD